MARLQEQQRLSGLRVGLVHVVPNEDDFDGVQATCAARAISRLEDLGADIAWLSNTQPFAAPESLDTLILFLHEPADDRFADRVRVARCESVAHSATRMILDYRHRRPDRLPQYQRNEVTAAQGNVVQLCGPRGILLDPANQERLRGTGLLLHYTNGGEVPDLGRVYRERVVPDGLSTPRYQVQAVLEDAARTLDRWNLGNRAKAEHVFMLIKHLVEEMDENTRRAQIRRPVPGDERNSLKLVLDGYECPANMTNRKNTVETIARGVRQTRQAIAQSLGLKEFPTPVGGSGTDTQKFHQLYWALHTYFGSRADESLSSPPW